MADAGPSAEKKKDKKKRSKVEQDLKKAKKDVANFFTNLVKPPPGGAKPVNIFAGLGKKKKKKDTKVNPGIAEEARTTGPASAAPGVAKRGQRKRRAPKDGDESGGEGFCRNGRLVGCIQHLTAVVRAKPDIAPVLFRATVAKVLSTRLASQIATASAVMLNNVLPTSDPYLVADAIKTYLKQQPNPLIEFDFYEPVIKIVSTTPNEEEAAKAIAKLFHEQQSGNDITDAKTMFAFLHELLEKIYEDKEAHKLLPYTLGPVLMWPEFPPSTLEEMTLLKNVPKAIEIVMHNYDTIFKPLANGEPENEPRQEGDPSQKKGPPPPPPGEDADNDEDKAWAAARAAEEAAAAAAAENKAEADEAKAAAAAAQAEAERQAKAAAEANKAALEAAAMLEQLKLEHAKQLEEMDEKDREAAAARMETERAEALARMGRLKPQTLTGAIQEALDLVPEYLEDCREALNEALRIAELEESIQDDPLQGDTELWARIFSFLGDEEMGRASLVCDTWYQANSQTEYAAERWKEAASRMLVDDFGEEMLPQLLALPETEQNLHGVPNPWYSITSRLAVCEYWGVPDDDDGETCSHLVVDVSGEEIVVGASLPDARPIKISSSVVFSDVNFVEALEAKLIAAIDRVLGSHSFLADTCSLLVLEGKGPSWVSNRKSVVKMIYNRFSPISLRIVSGTEAGFLVCGQTHGIVVDSGLSYTRIIPIVDLTPLNFAAAMIPIGGEDVSRELSRMLEDHGQSWPPAVINTLKHKHVYCSDTDDLDQAEESAEEVEYTFPNQSTAVLRSELFRAAEVVFSPEIMGKYCMGIAKQIMDIVERCPIDTRKPLLSNVFLIGGNCSIRNFASRLKTELNVLAWDGVRGSIKIDAHDTETSMYPYLGGTVLTDEYHERMEQFVAKDDFDEDPAAAYKRLFPHHR